MRVLVPYRVRVDPRTVLLFDEADTLFGRRTEVSNAHDRYANLETAYLLTRLERFEAWSSWATNLRQNVDPAFVCRLELTVDLGGGEEAVGHAPRTSLLVASEPITIRFPSGAWEYVVTERVPDAGDTLARDGKTWTVAGVTESEDGHRVITMAPEVVKPPTVASPVSEARSRPRPTSSPGRARRSAGESPR